MSKNDDFDYGMYAGRSLLLARIAYDYLGHVCYMPESHKEPYSHVHSALGQQYLPLEDAINEFTNIIKKNKNEQKFGVWTDPYIPKEYADIETDYIAREAVRSEIYHNQSCLNEYQLDTLPTADVKPNIKGYWIKTGQSFIYPDKFICYSCSECGYDIEKTKFNYCPNCGAKMESEK